MHCPGANPPDGKLEVAVQVAFQAGGGQERTCYCESSGAGAHCEYRKKFQVADLKRPPRFGRWGGQVVRPQDKIPPEGAVRSHQESRAAAALIKLYTKSIAGLTKAPGVH